MTMFVFAAISFILGIIAGVSATTDAYLRKAAEDLRNEANNITKGK